MTGAATRTASGTRFVTLDEARALECNGCGDCCDSRRTNGFWTWGELPEDQYRGLSIDGPLIIPLERVERGDGGEWRDRDRLPSDALELSPTRFRCSAFRPRPDGGGLCGLHGAPRPPRCGEFPVWGAGLAEELAERGEARLHTGAFPRCTWYGMSLVRDGDPRLEQRASLTR